MDKEMKEYFEQKFLVFATKDDIQKVRQESKANLRQLKEEDRDQIVEWRQEIKSDFEQLRKESRVELGPVVRSSEKGSRRLRLKFSLLLINQIKIWSHPFKR
jgi:hypothetical protein